MSLLPPPFFLAPGVVTGELNPPSRFVQALKRAGWSHVDHSGTTETAELHLSVTQALAPNPAPAQVVLPDDTFWDDFIASQQPKEYTSEDMLGGGAAGFGEDGWAVGLMEV